MTADVTAFLTILSMALFTILSIVGGYLLLNTAVTNIARESSYYTYTRLEDLLAQSFSSGSSGSTNMYLTGRFVLFFAKFSSSSEIPFYAYDGVHLSNVAVNLEGNDGRRIFEDIRDSSTGQRIYNDNVKSREELSKCVGDVCLCIGEMNSFLSLAPEYFKPNACVEICWGEDPSKYDACLNNPANQILLANPKQLMSTCNDYVKQNVPSGACARCLNYINSANNLYTSRDTGYELLILPIRLNLTNEEPLAKLEEFSESTKYSFISIIIECTKLSDIAESVAKNRYCYSKSNQELVPYYLGYYNSTGTSGVLSIISAAALEGTKPVARNVLFKLFNIDYEQNSAINPTQCYSYPSFITSEVRII